MGCNITAMVFITQLLPGPDQHVLSTPGPPSPLI